MKTKPAAVVSAEPQYLVFEQIQTCLPKFANFTQQGFESLCRKPDSRLKFVRRTTKYSPALYDKAAVAEWAKHQYRNAPRELETFLEKLAAVPANVFAD